MIGRKRYNTRWLPLSVEVRTIRMRQRFDRGRSFALHPAGRLALILVAGILLGTPALAYYFQGYYAPQVLISPMRDDMMYTPVGMGIVTSKAGFRIHPVTGKGDFHSGVDLGARLNDRVYELLDGVVTRVGWRGALGVAVEVYHPYPNVRSITGHLNAYSVLPGQWVTRGRVIGYAGSTGRSTGVHVHYTIIKQDTNEYIEPMKYLSTVPKYVQALKTARGKAALAAKRQQMEAEHIDARATDSKTEDLPEQGTKKAKPPPPEPAD
jgi:murein DD-endopeptidase MepM/ murein hydrolase activator NlpD